MQSKFEKRLTHVHACIGDNHLSVINLPDTNLANIRQLFNEICGQKIKKMYESSSFRSTDFWLIMVTFKSLTLKISKTTKKSKNLKRLLLDAYLKFKFVF